MKILYVEDSPVNLHAMKRIVTHLGYEFIAAESAQQGLQMLEQAPDIILLDIGLPDMDGYQLIAQIRRLNVDQPILAVTAHAMSGEREKCLSSGFDDYIAKPVGYEVMANLLKRYTHIASQ